MFIPMLASAAITTATAVGISYLFAKPGMDIAASKGYTASSFQFWAYAGGAFAINAAAVAASVATAGAASPIAASTLGGGFFAGAAVGVVSGFTSGMVSGAGITALGGGSGGDILLNGLRAGAIGAASGAVIGGVASGIAAKSGPIGGQRSFWTGKIKSTGVLETPLPNLNYGDPEGLLTDGYRASLRDLDDLASGWDGQLDNAVNMNALKRAEINILDGDFVHVTPSKYVKSILENGLDPSYSGGKSYVTRWSNIKNVTNPSDFNKILYRQDLWSSTAGKFDNGATILRINAKPVFYSPRTNWVNGVPQYIFTRSVSPKYITPIISF